MQYKDLTGLTTGQLHMLTLLVSKETGPVAMPGGRPLAIGLFQSVGMVVALMRRNLVQAVAGNIFGCSQPTVQPALGPDPPGHCQGVRPVRARPG